MRINVSELCQGMGVIQDGGGSSFSGAPQFGQSLALCPCQIAWCARDNGKRLSQKLHLIQVSPSMLGVRC